MDGVWHLNAPQWTDFESSPQTPDESYFERVHENLEPRPLEVEFNHIAETGNQKSELKDVKSKANQLKVSGANTDSLINEIEMAKMTPVKLQVSPRSRNKKNPKTRETTYDNVLSEAMASLQLSVKKKSRRSHKVLNTPSNLIVTPTNTDKNVTKSSNAVKGPRSTPSNPIPMWIRKTKPSEINFNESDKSVQILQESQEHKKQDNSPSQIATKKIQDTKMHEDETTTELVNIDENSNNGEGEGEKQLEVVVNPSVVDDVVDSDAAELPAPVKRTSNISQRSTFSNKAYQARFSTCSIRRRSLTQYRRRSNKFVSLAEAISKFQNKTPVRFRSVSSKNPKLGPVQMVRQSSVSATIPVSPALRCKSRSRPTTVLSQEERERLEVEEIRKNSVRENLARSNSLKTLSQGCGSRSNTKKAATSAEHSVEAKHSNVDKKANRETRVTRVTVPSVISTCEGVEVTDAEISNFGVPDITTAKLTTTKIVPFSFETRNKELQKKKEKKIKQLLTEEEKKIKVPFHARPVPTFKKPLLVTAKETNAVKPKTKPCPFSFEQRDKNLMKKKENFIKNVLEEDKKARVFQAKPIPEFKPVLVRGISKENINSVNKPQHAVVQQKNRVSMLPVCKTGSRSNLVPKSSVSNQENQNPSTKSGSQIPRQERAKSNEDKTQTQQKITTKVLAEFHLNTDKRAKERKEFDDRIKQKEQEIEMLRKEAEAEKLKRDETERAEIRKMAETKARPMPAYKIPVVTHSDKPLTEPQSPGWSTKPKR